MPRVSTPDQVSVSRQQLSQEEQGNLTAALEKGLEDTRTLATEVVRQKLQEYMDEIMVGAEIARAQFGEPFGGMNPNRSEFQLTRIQSGYFGYDSWEGNITGATAGATTTWLNDGGTDNVTGGTDSSFGNPLKIGDQAVHVVLGYGTYSPSPKCKNMAYRINNEPRAVVRTKYEWTQTDLGIKWLDTANVLPESAKYEAQPYIDVAGDAAPYLVGVSFIDSDGSEVQDPANMTDNTQDTSDNIIAQG